MICINIIINSILVLIQIYVTNLVILDTFLVIHYSIVNMIRIVKNIRKPIQWDGIPFKMAEYVRKYHSGTICKGVDNLLTSILINLDFYKLDNT